MQISRIFSRIFFVILAYSYSEISHPASGLLQKRGVAAASSSVQPQLSNSRLVIIKNIAKMYQIYIYIYILIYLYIYINISVYIYILIYIYIYMRPAGRPVGRSVRRCRARSWNGRDNSQGNAINIQGGSHYQQSIMFNITFIV